MLKVQLRGGFSDRNNIRPENTSMQTKEFDNRTRVALFNATNIVCNGRFNNFRYDDNDEVQRFIKRILSDVYSLPVEWSKLYPSKTALFEIYETIQKDEYDAVLTVIEFLVQIIDGDGYARCRFENKHYTATQIYNDVFEREYVGYRIIDRHIVPITDSIEIEAVSDALSNGYKEVQRHFSKALVFLSDREHPDYANSIKESISAVERMCSIIIGDSTTLGAALKRLEESGVVIHEAMKKAFEK